MWREIEIVFQAAFGDLRREVRLDQLGGTGNGMSFHLNVGGYYWGAFFKRGDEWVAPEQLTSDDIQILVEMIDDALTYQRLDLTLTVPVGEEEWRVNIFERSPWAFVIYIRKQGGYDDQYRGTIKKSNEEWTGEINYGAWEDLTGMDVPILIDIINTHKEGEP